MKKMMKGELDSIWIDAEGSAIAYGEVAGQRVLMLRDHIAALESEAAQARERALDGVCALADLEAVMLSACGDGGGANAVRVFADKLAALKSEHAREPKCSCRDPEYLLDCQIHGKPVEMASEENGLLPMSKRKPRREHEYGEERKAEFGTRVAHCVREGCQSCRIRTRDGEYVYLVADGRPDIMRTDEPGPCEVES